MTRAKAIGAAAVAAGLGGLCILGIFLFDRPGGTNPPPPVNPPPLVGPAPPAGPPVSPDAPAEPPAPTGPPGRFDFAVHSGPLSWSRLELRLDAHWGSRTSRGATLTAVTLPDTRAMGSPRHKVIYENRFALSGALSRAARARLHVRGAVCKAEVYLNKKLLGEGHFPEIPFSLDATKALKREGENLLEIVVHNRRVLKMDKLFRPAPPIGEGRMSSASSLEIWKRAHLKGPVTLILTGDPAIASARVTPSWRKKVVDIAVVLSNGSTETREVDLLVEVYLRGARVIRQRMAGRRVGPGEETIRATVPVQAPRPWGRPPHGKGELYTLVLTLSRRAAVLDQRAYAFGFREVWVDDDQLKLNNKRLFLLAKRDAINKHGQVPTERLFAASREHGFNAWHVHFSNVQPDFFSLCDELGQYAVPGLICAGAIELGSQEPGSRTRQFLNDYLRSYFAAFHNHPSILVWGQELGYNMVNPNTDLGLDRPGLDVDIRGMYGSMKQLRAFKAFARTGKLKSYNGTSIVGLAPGIPANVAFIGEIHQEPNTPEQVVEILKDCSNLAGCILASDYETPAKGSTLKHLLAELPGLSTSPLTAKVLPAIRVVAKDDLCVLYGKYNVAPRHLSGSLVGAGGESRLAVKEEGLLKIQTVKKQGETAKKVQIKKTLFTGKRPVMELDL